MTSLPISAPTNSAANVQDVYTDLHSINKLKGETTDVALKKVAQEFESIFINIMLKNMRSANAVFEKDSLFQSNESKMYRDMYDQQLALTMSKGKGVGIAEVLFKQLKGQYGQAEPADKKQEGFAINQEYSLQNKKAFPLDDVKRLPTQPVSSPLLPEASSILGGSSANNKHQAEAAKDTKEPKTFKNKEEFVDHILPAAKKVAGALGLNPLMMVAQAVLETGWGQHVIKGNSGSSNNLFNIKADASWHGESIRKNTLEYKDGVAVKEQAKFRKYESFGESFQDFISFIQENPRYQKALSAVGDDQQFINELHKAGYATDPKYSEKVLSVYQRLKTMVNQQGNG